MNAFAKPNPGYLSHLFDSVAVNPKDKADRRVGFSPKELCEYCGICSAGADQILECYRNVDEWLTPDNFKILCSECENAVENDDAVFAAAHKYHNYICVKNPKAFVYLVSDGEYVKIGKAVDPYKRLAEIQTGNPKRCSIVAAIPCHSSFTAHKLEHFLHNCFRSKRTVGEWFDIAENGDVARFQTAYPPRKEEENAADIP